MAKARPIAGVAEDDAFAIVAARVVETRTRELVEHAEGVLDLDDIERLHDMRVATRRLRAALEVFAPCFPRKRFRAALREVKGLADALGERRDRDVTLGALDRFASGLGAADRPGVHSLATAIREEQAAANLRLAPSVTSERVEALAERLFELAAAAEALVEPPPDPEPPPEPKPREPMRERRFVPPSEAAEDPAPRVGNGGDPR
jgi:CHAD domain-containing protein